MESSQGTRPWNNVQVYGMAAICLLLGIVAGYLLHAPVVANSTPNPREYSPAATPSAAANAPQSMPSASDLKRMADKKVEPLLEQLTKNPKDADLLEQIGRSYLAAQQFQSAQQYLEQSVAAKPKPGTLNELSFVYAKIGDMDKAVAALKQARDIDPKNPQVLFNLGFFEWRGKSDPKAAIDAWQALLKADPNNPKRAQVEQMIAQAKKHLSIAPGTKTDKPAM
jgi:tetratricopeptide (TPR) repeat protein